MRLFVAIGSLLGFSWMALPAMACSRMAPPAPEEVVDENSRAGPVDGVFEYQHIAWTPNLGYRAARTVSAVVRYWGRVPEPNGLEIHGEHFLTGSITSSCDNGSGWLGTVSYGIVEPDEPSIRAVEGLDVNGALTRAQSALLEERFGPPVEIPVSPTSRAAAWFLVLWQPVLLLVAVLAGSVWLVKRRRTRSLTANP